MKFNGHVDIQQPLEKVVELFANPQYLGEYQDNFLRKELKSGDAGTDGAVSKMYYKFGKSEMEITETITANQLPHSFEGFYHHIHMDNTLKYSFEELNPNETRYSYEVDYIRIAWVMPKLIAILFPNMYRKQVEKWMMNFKAFAEKG